jgi:hypothetical protein
MTVCTIRLLKKGGRGVDEKKQKTNFDEIFLSSKQYEPAREHFT